MEKNSNGFVSEGLVSSTKYIESITRESWLALFLVIFIITTIILIIYLSITASNKKKKQLTSAGKICSNTSQCENGLTCMNNVCLIPVSGSCKNYANGCVPGSVCQNDVCIPNLNIARIQGENARRNLTGTVVPLTKKIVYSTNPDMSNISELYNGNFVDYTIGDGIAYILQNDGRILRKNTNNLSQNLSYLTTNIPIQNIEWSNDKLYTIINGTLYSGSVSDVIMFNTTGEKCDVVIPNPQSTELYKVNSGENGNIVLGNNNDYLTYDNNKITYFDADGNSRTITNDAKYPMLYNGNVYLNNLKTKAYRGLFTNVV